MVRSLYTIKMSSLLAVGIILVYTQSSNALQCYLCDTPTSSACGSNFNETGRGVIKSTCLAGLNTCHKQTTKAEAGEIILRYCGPTLPSDCTSSNGLEVCLHVCNTDLCNKSVSLSYGVSIITSLILALLACL